MEMETEMEKIERIKITPEMVNWESLKKKNNHSQCIHTGRSVHRMKNLSLYLTSLHKNRIFGLSLSLVPPSLSLSWSFNSFVPFSMPIFILIFQLTLSLVPMCSCYDLWLYVWENFPLLDSSLIREWRKKSHFSVSFFWVFSKVGKISKEL